MIIKGIANIHVPDTENVGNYDKEFMFELDDNLSDEEIENKIKETIVQEEECEDINDIMYMDWQKVKKI